MFVIEATVIKLPIPEVTSTDAYWNYPIRQPLLDVPLRRCYMDSHSELAFQLILSFFKEWHAKAEEYSHRTTAHDMDMLARYDQHARNFPKLNVGQHFRIQNTSNYWDKVKVTMGIGKSRDYEVRLLIAQSVLGEPLFSQPSAVPQ